MSKADLGKLDIRQIQATQRKGDANVVQMFGGGGTTTGHTAVYDAAGNIVDGGAVVAGTVAVQLAGTTIGSPRGTLNFIAGAGITLSITDSGGKINITISLGPPAPVSPGGGGFAIVESPGYAFVW